MLQMEMPEEVHSRVADQAAVPGMECPIKEHSCWQMLEDLRPMVERWRETRRRQRSLGSGRLMAPRCWQQERHCQMAVHSRQKRQKRKGPTQTRHHQMAVMHTA